MELKDFIQTAVTQIVEGVVAAQAAAAAHHVVVNPAIDLQRRNGASPGGHSTAPRVSDISFDVAVTGVESSTAPGSGKLQVAGSWSARAGAETHAATAEPFTRLQFSLPIAFPEARVRRTATAALDSEFLQSVDNGDSTWLPS
jgi:hypothetical protein